MKVYLAADHAGFNLKEEIKNYLSSKGVGVEDCGNFEKVEDDDYPDFISKAAEKVSSDPNAKGIVFGKSGAGECIVANKFQNVRAIVAFNNENVQLSRDHNDANILCLGSQFTDFETVKQMVDIFLNTPFSNNERHMRRLSKISSIENK